MKNVLAASILSLTFFGFSSMGYGAGQVMHTVHIVEDRGPMIEDHLVYPDTCFQCHTGSAHGGPLDYDLCNGCHSPGGTYDGVNDPVVGARFNTGSEVNPDEWVSDIYDAEGKLKPGKENWCLGCHDDGYATVHAVDAPNIAGKSFNGTWQSPTAIVESGFQGAENLIDGDLATGNLAGNDPEVVFDMGIAQEITHIRLHVNLEAATHWQVYGSNDLVNWDQILLGSTFKAGKTNWEVGSAQEWVEYRLDSFDPVRYVKLVRLFTQAHISVDAVLEFEYKGDLQYGYLVNGHKISCDNCHDTTSLHVDGIAQTYKSDLNNYTAGYRLADVMVGSDVVPALEIPRVDCNDKDSVKSENDFALCLSCHDRYNLLGDAYGVGDFFRNPPVTNFRNDAKVDANGNVANDHLRHLGGRGNCGNAKDWDSDWDGVPDSPQSCTACHNVHGSPNPAMTRHGELASTPGTSDKVPMFNFQYLDGTAQVDPEMQDVFESTGGKTQFFTGGPGTPDKNNTCRMCHNDRVVYTRTP